MPKLLSKALSMITGSDQSQLLKMPKISRPLGKLTERELIQLESEIGGKLFGPVPEGGRREFFNLDAKTWIWYEEFTDQTGAKQSVTTRYEVQGDKILKAQDGAHYSYLDDGELRDFTVAVQMYYEQVMRGIYHRDPSTGQKFSA